MAKTKKTNLAISDKWQITFIIVSLIGFVSPFATTLVYSLGNNSGASAWGFQLTFGLPPVLFFILAVLYTWRQYKTLLNRIFMATFLASIAYGAYVSFSSLESALRYRFYPPVINSTAYNNSVFTAYGHEWLIMGISASLFAAVLLWLKSRRSA